MNIIDILKERLCDPEDQFTERKEKGVSTEDIADTLVAFANTLPLGHEGVLFIGVADSGELKGVENSDKMQRNIQRIAANRCYPPISLQHIVVLKVEGIEIVAVVVPASETKPHFAGQAIIRVGSQNIRASDEILNQLIASRNTKARLILDAMNQKQKVTLRLIGVSPMNGIVPVEAEIKECNVHYVRLTTSSGPKSFPLSRTELCWDENKDRLSIEAYSEFRS